MKMPHINPHLIPNVMIALDFAAAAVYASDKNWKQTVYWLLCAAIVYVVTY